jgi:hypothetical protein
MASLLDNIRDGLELVVDKTEEYGKIGKLKVDIFSIKRNIEKQFTELGGRTFEVLTGEGPKTVAKDEEVKKIVEELQGLEEQLQQKEAEIAQVKEEKEKERQTRQDSRKKDSEKVEVADDVEDIDATKAEDVKIVDEKESKE